MDPLAAIPGVPFLIYGLGLAFNYRGLAGWATRRSQALRRKPVITEREINGTRALGVFMTVFALYWIVAAPFVQAR